MAGAGHGSLAFSLARVLAATIVPFGILLTVGGTGGAN